MTREFVPINPRYFLGVIGEYNGELEYRHIVPMVASNPRSARDKLKTRARNWYGTDQKYPTDEGMAFFNGRCVVMLKDVHEVTPVTFKELKDKHVL